jgi:hypothetical protein
MSFWLFFQSQVIFFNPKKWRGIALLDICSKAVSSIAATRLANHLKGFGIGKNRPDQHRKKAAPMRLSPLEDSTSTNSSRTLSRIVGMYVLFVDLVQAYDTVNREMLYSRTRLNTPVIDTDGEAIVFLRHPTNQPTNHSNICTYGRSSSQPASHMQARPGQAAHRLVIEAEWCRLQCSILAEQYN